MPSAQEVDSMVVRLLGDGSSYKNMLAMAREQTGRFVTSVGFSTQAVAGMTASVRGYASTAIAALAPLVGIGASLGTVFKSVQAAAEQEKVVIEFGVLLKDDNAGKEMVKRLQKLAADTPLNMPDLQKGAKQLLQSGVGGEDVVERLRTLGDLALGDAEKLQRLAYAYGEIKRQGKIQMDEVMQMSSAGYNPMKDLEKVTGKRGGDLQAAMAAGTVGVRELDAAMKAATSEGGNFFKGMEKQSKSLSGLFSTMQDDISSILRELGDKIVEAFNLKDVTKQVSELAQGVANFIKDVPAGFMQVAAAVTVATVAVGGLTAALLLAWVTLNAATGGLTLAFGLVAGAVTSAIVALSGVIVGAGGVGAAFAGVVGWAKGIWEQLEPVRRQLVQIGRVVYDLVASGLRSAAGYVSDLWGRLTGGQGGWERFKETALDALLAVEFGLKNTGLVADLAWAGIRYGLEAAKNTAVHLFTSVLPAALAWFYQNAGALAQTYGRVWVAQAVYYKDVLVATFESIDWNTVWEGFKTAAMAAIMAVVGMTAMIGKLATMPVTAAKAALEEFKNSQSGTPGEGNGLGTRLAEITQRHVQKVKDIWANSGTSPFAMPDRVPPESEQKLKEEYQRLGKEAAESFAEFKKKRLAEMEFDRWFEEFLASYDEEGKLSPGEEQQQQAGKKSAAATAAEQASATSAEGARRLAEYRDRLRDFREGPQVKDQVAHNTKRTADTLDRIDKKLTPKPAGPESGFVQVGPANLGGYGDGGDSFDWGGGGGEF